VSFAPNGIDVVISDPDFLKTSDVTRKSIERTSIVLTGTVTAQVLASGKVTNDNMLGEREFIELMEYAGWETAKMQSQARWGLCQSYLLLKEHEAAFKALCKSIERGDSLGKTIMAIEAALPVLPSERRAIGTDNIGVITPATAQPQDASPPGQGPSEQQMTLEEVEARLAEIDAKLTGAPTTIVESRSTEKELAEAEKKVADGQQTLSGPSDQEMTLEEVEARLAEIDAKLSGVPSTSVERRSNEEELAEVEKKLADAQKKLSELDDD
jgi:hypothetical protein